MITVLFWPDGTWCYRHELEQMAHMGDDYTVMTVDDSFMDDEIDGINELVKKACQNG